MRQHDCRNCFSMVLCKGTRFACPKHIPFSETRIEGRGSERVRGYCAMRYGVGAKPKEVPSGEFYGSAVELPRLQRIIYLDRWRTKLLPRKGIAECTGPLSDVPGDAEVADGRPTAGAACGDLRGVRERDDGAVYPAEWATGLLQPVLRASSRGGHLSQPGSTSG
jgi:hypothetical protein